MDLDKRVVGGREAKEGEFPFVANLQYTHDKIPLQCVGTIIHEQVIIVPAFCVVHLGTNKVVDYKELIVGYGSVERSKQQHARVVTIVVNPEFAPKEMASDIALLQVEPLNLTYPNVARIPIYTGSIHPDQRLDVMGWGNDKETNGEWTETLRTTSVVVGGPDVCAQSPNYNGPEGRVLCTDNKAYPGHDLCDGEFGASLVVKVDGAYQLVGTYSYHTDSSAEGYNRCAKNTSLAFYTHVYSYLGFIASSANVPADTFTNPFSEERDGTSGHGSGLRNGLFIAVLVISALVSVMLVSWLALRMWQKRNTLSRSWQGHTYELAHRSAALDPAEQDNSASDLDSIYEDHNASNRLVAEIMDIE
ncbi:Ovochymase-1 [Coemansia sp. RSA 1722]